VLSLVIWQLRYAWKSWIGSLVTFSIAGLVIGFTLIGVNSTIKVNLNHGVYNPVVFFSTPAIFGLITLILVISGITRLLINKFKSDYELWATLGANSSQLALLISGQMSLSGMIGGLLGYFLSYPLVGSFYSWVRTTPGMREFPVIHMSLQISSLLLTILVMGIVIGIMGFINSKRIFSGIHTKRGIMKQQKNGLSLFGYIWCVITYGGLIYVYSLFYKNPLSLAKLFGSPSLENAYLQALLALIILMILAINASETLILPILMKSLPYWYPTTLMKTFRTAFWSVSEKKDFLRSVTMPLFIFSLISSFFMYMAFDLANVASRRNLSEIIGTLILFLGAPFLIILANTISLTIISSSQRSSSTHRLQIIGFSLTDLLSEKCAEASIYGIIVFIQGVIGNALLYVPILQASYYTHTQMHDGWLSITWLPAVAGLIVFLFILIVDGTYVCRISLSAQAEQ